MEFPKEIWVYSADKDIASKFYFTHKYIDVPLMNSDKWADYAGYDQAVEDNGAKLGVSLSLSEGVVFSGSKAYKYFTTFGECIDYRQSLLKEKIKQLSLQFDQEPRILG